MNLIIIAIITLLVFAIYFCYLRLGSVPFEKIDMVPVEPHVYQGDLFSVVKDIKVRGLIIWGAPYGGGFDCILPAGTILVAENDAVLWAEGFAVVPINYNELEKQLVPEADRTAKKYGGYCFSFLKSDIGEIIIRKKQPNQAAAHRR